VYSLPTVDLRVFIFSFALLGSLGFLVRLWASGYMMTGVVHSDTINTDVLITSGPYSHTRNPLYFGTMLMTFGFLPELSPQGFAFLLMATILIIFFLIRAEETALLTAYGKVYETYRKSVPAFLPTLRHQSSSQHFTFSLSKAIKTEISNVYIFSTFMALSLNSVYFSISLILLLLIGLTMRQIWMRAV
jgi:hypothetical protein